VSPADWASVIVGVVTGLSAFFAVIRWLVKHYLSELKPNSGGSLNDKIVRLESRVDEIYSLLLKS
jgi:hypothetical protein